MKLNVYSVTIAIRGSSPDGIQPGPAHISDYLVAGADVSEAVSSIPLTGMEVLGTKVVCRDVEFPVYQQGAAHELSGGIFGGSLAGIDSLLGGTSTSIEPEPQTQSDVPLPQGDGDPGRESQDDGSDLPDNPPLPVSSDNVAQDDGSQLPDNPPLPV